VDALVGAMQRNGMMTILAEPNLTAQAEVRELPGEAILILTGNQAGQITVTTAVRGLA
jgi:Flp pilus assembly secretin CpaC